jgi:ABC-type taurine transport system ATPase subunit
MLTRLVIRNFKGLTDADIELGQSVVFVGPNNSGKTTALQALALWEVGLRRWREKRAGKTAPEERVGVAIGRKDLIAVPVPVANLLWRDLHVRKGARENGRTKTQNIVIEVRVDGITNGDSWSCGLEFDYANEESFYCRPLRTGAGADASRTPVPQQAFGTRVAFLPPMSGLAATEPRWEPGRVNVLIGEGQTAQVLRNLCHAVRQSATGAADWTELCAHVRALFGVELLEPVYVQERGEITMAYREPSGVELDLSCSGRGLQQTLLLLAHLYANPKTVLLLDEPDAHLEVLRQRQTYRLLNEVAAAKGSQIVATTHSEVVLNAAADKEIVVAFLGKPHRIDDRAKQQVAKSLKEFGFEQYSQAEQTGWVLYLEGDTDLDILRAFASTLGHPAKADLDRPFLHPVGGNSPAKARAHFHALLEARPDLVGFALYDRIAKELTRDQRLVERAWAKREIENYLCVESAFLRFAVHDLPDDLFAVEQRDQRIDAMEAAIREVEGALKTLRRPGPWSPDVKACEEFLDPLFRAWFEKLGLENLMRKSDYHRLAALVPKDAIDPEVVEMLDALHAVASRARAGG